MADIRPFQAIRPAKGQEEIISALPYDVYNRAEAREVVLKNPHSFLAIDRAETQFPEDADMYADYVYEKASSMLKEWRENGLFIKEEKPCYYIYELTMSGRVQTGIVACASIDDYQNNIIKKHENTRAEKEQDRIRHVDTCNAQTGPIFLAYRANQKIAEIVAKTKMEKPLYDFVAEDGVGHRVWVIDSTEDIALMKETFASINAIYIADGHHRCASAVKVGLKRRESDPEYTGKEEYNYFLSVLFPDNELMIMDYNRVVKDLNGMTAEEFKKKLLEKYEISDPADAPIRPKKKGETAMYLEGKWYLLILKENLRNSDPVDGLDVSILQKYVLADLLDIRDPKTDQRIDFVGGIRGLEELERRATSDCVLAFAMYPTSIGELFAVSDAGLLMPPKSTWFEPKLRSGLFIHELQ